MVKSGALRRPQAKEVVEGTDCRDGMLMSEADFLSLENRLMSQLAAIAVARNRIHETLRGLTNGKKLKGDEIVGWLGEVYGKFWFDGELVDDGLEHDLLTPDGRRISIKSRKGHVWQETSAIPKIEGEGSPTHLLFLRFSDDYTVHTIWYHHWETLRLAGRFKVKRVRKEHRSYIFRVNQKLDNPAIIYQRSPPNGSSPRYHNIFIPHQEDRRET